jgi:hypothetical protein
MPPRPRDEPPEGASPGAGPRAEDLVARLDFPRDAAPGLERARVVLEELLSQAGVVPERLPFDCRTGRADLGAALCAVAAAGVLAAGWRSSRRLLAASLATLGLAMAGLGGGLDGLLPATEQTSLQVTIEPRAVARTEIVVGAHYDTKTEPLDHVGRAVLFAGAAIAWGAAALAIATRRRGRRLGAGVAALGLGLVAAQLAGGRLLTARSHGILDDGAAAALLVEMAARADAEPPAATRLRFVWWAGEEVGAQGSDAYFEAWATLLPRQLVNLECIGAGPELAATVREWAGWRPRACDAGLVAALAEAADAPMHRLGVPILTDAGSALRRGVPATTLLTLPAGRGAVRGLHGAGDRASALDPRGIAAARRTLGAFLARADAEAASRPAVAAPGPAR